MGVAILSILLILYVLDVSASAKGENNYEPKFIDGLTESVTTHGTVGKNVKLMCKVASDPASFTTWYKQENIIDGSKRIRIFKNYLLIRKAKTEDIGEYQCTAENPFGNVVRHFVVNISSKHTNDNERKHGQTEDITMLRKELKNLKNRVESLSSNDIHLHMYTGNDDAQQHEVEKIGNGNHIYLNMLLKDYRPSNHVSNIHKDIHAHCEMTQNNNYEDVGLITGNIRLVQRINGSVTVDIHLSGFDMSEVGMSHEHGFHVHQFGDLSNSCDSLGDIYKRRSQRGHGRHSSRKSIMCDDDGEVNLKYTDNTISLYGQHSVIGRSFVVHNDFKNRRMACCVIGRTETRDRDTVDKHGMHVKEELIEHHIHKHVDPFRPDPTTEE